MTPHDRLARHVPYWTAKMTRTTPGTSDPAMSGEQRQFCRYCEFVWPCDAVILATGVTLAPAPLALDAHPGEPHEFEMTCRRCGEPGFLNVAFTTPSEMVRIELAAALAPQAPDAAEPRHAFTPGVHDGVAVYCAHCGLLRAHPAHREPAP